MSNFSCPVVEVESIEDHSNADRLSVVRMKGLGYTAITNKKEDGSPRYKVGDLVVYIPSASLLPEWLLKEMDFWNEEQNKGYLSGSAGNRVGPKKLRGIFSEGVLYPVDNSDTTRTVKVFDVQSSKYSDVSVELNEDVSEILGIEKYSPPIPGAMSGEIASLFDFAIKYDLDRYESMTDIFDKDDIVIADEKIHGTNFCITYSPMIDHPEMFGKFLISSKGLAAQGLFFKDNLANTGNIYVRTFREMLNSGFKDRVEDYITKYNLLHDSPVMTFRIFMEIFGPGVQDLNYGLSNSSTRAFDIKINNKFLSRDVFGNVCEMLGLETVPCLYKGPFNLSEIEKVRDGKSAIGNGANIREGVVVRTLDESQHPYYGRKIAKFISPDYLLRKVKNGEPTEFN